MGRVESASSNKPRSCKPFIILNHSQNPLDRAGEGVDEAIHFPDSDSDNMAAAPCEEEPCDGPSEFRDESPNSCDRESLRNTQWGVRSQPRSTSLGHLWSSVSRNIFLTAFAWAMISSTWVILRM